MFNLEALLLLTPATTALYIVAAIIILYHIVATGRTARESRGIQSMLVQIARRYIKKSVTFVVVVNQSADELIPLFDHLHSRKGDFSIVVRVQPSANRDAKGALEAYRRTYKLGNRLRIVTQRRPMTDAALVKRFATGDIIIPLESYHRLPRVFFRYVSFAFIDERVQAVQFRRYRRPVNTLQSAFRSMDQQWASAVNEALPPFSQSYVALASGIAVRKETIMAKDTYRPHYLLSDRLGLDETQSVVAPLSPLVAVVRSVIFFVIGIFLVQLLSLSSPTTAGFIGLLMLSLVVLTALAFIVSPRGLSIGDKVTLILLLPFYPLYLLIDALRVVAGFASKLLRRSIISLRVAVKNMG